MSLKALALAFTAISALSLPALAEDKSANEIFRDLTPTVKSRSLGAPRIAVEDKELIEDLGRDRAITVTKREKLKEVVITYEMPKLDLDIYFDYDSYDITPKARIALNELGKALLQLGSDGQFILSGHTDSRGSDSYNLQLSEFRAWAVRDYLADRFDIDPSRLIALGYGEEDPKDPYNPESGINRRVTVINVVAQK